MCVRERERENEGASERENKKASERERNRDRVRERKITRARKRKKARCGLCRCFASSINNAGSHRWAHGAQRQISFAGFMYRRNQSGGCKVPPRSNMRRFEHMSRGFTRQHAPVHSCHADLDFSNRFSPRIPRPAAHNRLEPSRPGTILICENFDLRQGLFDIFSTCERRWSKFSILFRFFFHVVYSLFPPIFFSSTCGNAGRQDKNVPCDVVSPVGGKADLRRHRWKKMKK